MSVKLVHPTYVGVDIDLPDSDHQLQIEERRASAYEEFDLQDIDVSWV